MEPGSYLLIALLALAACGKKAEVDSKSSSRPTLERDLRKLSDGDHLRHAVEGNDPRSVEALLRKGVDPNLLMSSGQSLLTYAIEQNHASVVEVLLVGGADANRADKFSRRPLFEAISAPNALLARLLVIHGAELNLPDGRGRTPLMRAIQMREEDLALWLLERGARVADRDLQGKTAIDHAQDLALPYLASTLKIRLQLELGITSNDLLIELITLGDIRGMRHLLQQSKSAISLRASPSLLHYALAIGDRTRALEALTLLLSYDLDPNGEEGEALPPLATAVKRGDGDLIRGLLNAGADLERKDEAGRTPLIYAVKHAHVEVVRELLALKALKKYQHDSGAGPLTHDACSYARITRQSAVDKAQQERVEKIMQHLGCGLRWLFFW